MKLNITLYSIVILVALYGLSIAENISEEKNARIEPVTSSILVSALVPVVTNFISGLFGSLFKPTDYQDTVIFGRSMRIKMCGNTCVQITDRASGITSVGNGNSPQEAIGEATKKIFDELIVRGLLSMFDLCEANVVFPHPIAGCPPVNPCNLLIWHQTTQKPCVNKLGDSYCSTHQTRCDIFIYQDFMHENCWKTCTKGKCTLQEPGPVDKCSGVPN